MITINATNLGKRFNRDWIFRNLNNEFISGRSYAITGPNGSGKSTLLQILAGSTMLSEGTVDYSLNGSKLDTAVIYKYVSFTAPYLEVIEEMSLKEFFAFHSGMKPWVTGITSEQIITLCGLERSAYKQIRYFSSGMKQRVRLALAIFSDGAIVFLDEPCSNFDEPGIQLYRSLLAQYLGGRLLIIASNDKPEYEMCDEIIELKKL